MSKSKFKLLPQPQKYKTPDETTLVRLTRDVTGIVDAINLDRMIQDMPMPDNLTVGFYDGFGVIRWDDVDDSLRADLDGARIWRADASLNNNTNFSENDARRMIVACIRSTTFIDAEVQPGDYIYWVQWVNLDGTVSRVAGGVRGTMTIGDGPFIQDASATERGLVSTSSQTLSGTKTFLNPITAQNVAVSGLLWDDSQQSAIALKDVGSGVPVLTQYGSTGIYWPKFQVNDLLVFSIQFPHTLAEEDTVEVHPHVHWVGSTTSPNTVKWQLQYQWLNIQSETISATSTVITTEEAPTAGILNLTTFSTTTKTGALISSFFVGNIKRVTNGATEYTGDVWMMSFDVHHKKDTLGSQNPGTKTWPDY